MLLCNEPLQDGRLAIISLLTSSLIHIEDIKNFFVDLFQIILVVSRGHSFGDVIDGGYLHKLWSGSFEDLYLVIHQECWADLCLRYQTILHQKYYHIVHDWWSHNICTEIIFHSFNTAVVNLPKNIIFLVRITNTTNKWILFYHGLDPSFFLQFILPMWHTVQDKQ